MQNRLVAIWDQNQLCREGLSSLLGSSQFIVSISSDSLAEVLDECEAHLRPALIICCLNNNDEIPAEIADQLAAGNSDSRFVILANSPTRSLLRQAVDAGVHAVLSKNISGEILQRALEFVLLGQRLFPAPAVEGDELRPLEISNVVTTLDTVRLFGRPRSVDQAVQLSEREAQILGCLIEGEPNKRIARELGITEATVKVHIKGLLRKLRVNNRTQAAIWGLNNAESMESRIGTSEIIKPAVAFSIAS